MPLLCVAARYGSSSANRDAAAIARDLGAATRRRARVVDRGSARVTVRPSVRFDRMRRPGAAARDARDAIGERLAQRVDEVRAHRVAAVDVEVDDEHAAVGAVRCASDAHLERDRTAAALGEARHEAARVVEQAVGARRAATAAPRIDVVDVRDLDLADHHRRRRAAS